MRHENWQARFWSEITDAAKQGFRYGSHDCILFGAKMADAITVDGKYVERARQAYDWNNSKDALRILQSQALGVLVESVLGPMARWQVLQHGDLVLMAHDSGSGVEQLLGVHDGAQVIAPAASGLISLWWTEALGGWRIE